MTTAAAPVQVSDRHETIDLLRGFALLGILILNIQSFAMPFAAYLNTTALGDRGQLDFAVWTFGHLLFDQKFMTIFSLLFGAGILLMTSRAAERSGRSAALHYRRMFWLLVFGLMHAYLIWYGDILVPYAVSGLVIYLFRRRSPRTLVICGVLSLLVASIFMLLGGMFMPQAPPEAKQEILNFWSPSAAVIQEEITAFQGGWLAQFPKRMEYALGMHTFEMWIWAIWRAGGLMLIGMALLKWGVITGERSANFYARMSAAGFVLGLPLIALGVQQMQARQWEALYSFFHGGQYNYWGSLMVSTGWIGLVLLLWKRGALGAMKARLVAVGRTAFSCYILTSLICTFIFYGHGLGLFGRVGRPGQWLVTVLVWIVMLIAAPWWLERFRFGPLEWVWRSLTYGERQPMRRAQASAVPVL
jgi:uncharacterized protein